MALNLNGVNRDRLNLIVRRESASIGDKTYLSE